MTDQIEWKVGQWYDLSNGTQAVCVATEAPEGVKTSYPITLRGKKGVVYTAKNSGVIYPGGLHVTGPVEPEVTEWKVVCGCIASNWLATKERAVSYHTGYCTPDVILRRVRKGNKVVSLEIERDTE